MAMHPDAPYFAILLCLTPDDFTLQGKSVATQWVNLIIYNNCDITFLNVFILLTQPCQLVQHGRMKVPGERTLFSHGSIARIKPTTCGAFDEIAKNSEKKLLILHGQFLFISLQ
jgi:hypothetical protein